MHAMIIDFRVSKPGSFFQVVDSLSNWSWHTRKRLRENYISVFGLSASEESILSSYAAIRENHGWGRLDTDFVLAVSLEQALQNAKKRLVSGEFSSLSDVFTHFAPNLEKMYAQKEPYLQARREALETEAKNFDWNRMFSEVAAFYESKDCPDRVQAHLIMSYGSGGGAHIEGNKNITLEPRQIEKNNSDIIQADLDTAAHEIGHLVTKYYEHEERKDLTIKKIKERFGDEGLYVIHEAIHDSLFPDGVMSVKYGLKSEDHVKKVIDRKLGVDVADDNRHYLHALRNKLGARLFDATADALATGRIMFDSSYLDNAINEYATLKENYKQ
jgi:hypothetical protein